MTMTTTLERASTLPERAAAPRRSRRGSLQTQRHVTAFLLTLPALALVGGLIVVPVGQAVYYSMTQWNGITTTWIGPSAYLQTFENPTFWEVLQNNALLLLAVPFALALPMGVAVLLHERVAGWKFFRSAYFMPTAISWVVIGMVAERFFSYGGLLSTLLGWTGVPAIKAGLVGTESTALLALAITFIWSMVGTNTMIFLTGLATLDENVHQAAFIDGASHLQAFVHVTLPHMKRFVQLAFVLTTISAFSALFSLIFVMTGGGPGYSTTTIEFFIYQTGFDQAQFGTAALYGIILFVIMAVVGIVQLRLIRSST
ncbi:MAG TPA: sugar ABC transporter permease [Acidimicrobiales bacterium]|nr:sugar ABC transporter permease [Acidimicrobiales bacterium]